MPYGKRKRSASVSSRAPRKVRKTAKRTGKAGNKRFTKRVSRLEKMIETKDNCWKTAANVALPHNQLLQLQCPATGGRLNMFFMNVGAADNMAQGGGQRIGDEIYVERVVIKGMIENALGRPKVNYRVMVIRSAKGDIPTRATLFRGITGNKLIDEINNERYTVLKQKIFTINSTNPMANTVTTAGVPIEAPQLVTGNAAAGIGTKVFSMSIPGTKFFRGGRCRYEDASASQVKFYDYHVMIMTYDWFGTPDDILTVFNDVGKLNELYVKVYYKDA